MIKPSGMILLEFRAEFRIAPNSYYYNILLYFFAPKVKGIREV